MQRELVDDTQHLIFTTPILNTRVMDELASILRHLATETAPRPVILRSAHPSVFLAGADLGEIITLDASTCIEYARRGRGVVDLLENHPAPTVAAVSGSCSGGGFDLVMACDAVVAGEQSSFEHPGVRRGLVTGWSGSVSGPTITGPAVARATFIAGTRIDSKTATALGLVCRIGLVPGPDAIEVAQSLARLQPSRLRLWRLLRGRGFVDSFRASVVHKL